MTSKTQKVESFASVSSSIMMKIPTDNLSSLRTRFQEGPDGLDLSDFLVAVISNMDISDIDEMMLTVADLIDFFHLVDINGDGFMEWEEFVMFVLDSVVQDSKAKKNEAFVHSLTRQVQSAAVRNPVVSSIIVPALGKYLMGVGHEIQMYFTEEKSPPAHVTLSYKLHLTGSDKPLSQYMPGEKMLSVLDMAFLESSDILAVLRSDQTLEFFRFLSRSNYSSETIENLGRIVLAQPCHRICWRSMDNRADRLMAIGTYNEIHHWLFVPSGDNGSAELKDHKVMEKHSDYVRAIITVNTYFAKYVVSASLDKTVVLWDLASLEYRSVRTGHSAGVESLAFGGKNLLFAGGYDYSIIVWDLEAAINRPLFYMHGHNSCVTRIIAMESIERCASLDEEGKVFWWDISKNTPGATSTSRFIDSYVAPEDRARTLGVFTDLSHNYMALHGVIFAVGGRRQHIFKLKDCNVQESAPVCTLYSQDLLSVYTIHTHDIIFWSAVNAYQHKVINGLVSKHARITCGILDDRRRRMIIGDSNGVVRFFNCLNGVCLKTYPAFVSPVKSLMYSSDKNVLVLLDNSDIMVIDDAADGADSDCVLREVRIPVGGICGDLLCMAFSQALGIVVTVDMMGMLIVWDYAYLTPLHIFPNISGNDSEIGRIEFIGNFPLLLLVDNSKNFTVMSFETLSSNNRVEIWHLESELSPYIVKEEEEEEDAQTEDEDEDEGGDSGARAKPFLYQKAAIFRNKHGEAKRMVIHMDDEEEDEEIEDEEEKVKADSPEDIEKDNEREKKVDRSPAPKRFPQNLSVHVVCGYDDGTMMITDITSALRKIDIGPMTEEDFLHDQLGYNAKLKGSRHLGDSDAVRIVSEEKIKSMERFSQAIIKVVWKPHSAPVVSLSVVGEYKWILTASEDCSIQVWDIDARFCGLLTRGSAMDKLFRNVWNNPEDMELRSLRRIGTARMMIDDLKLEHVSNGSRKNSVESGGSSTYSLQRLKMGENTRSQRERLTTDDPRDLVKLLEESPIGGLDGGSVSSLDIRDSLAKVKDFPERSRLICQFDGHMTYDPSKKDIAQMQLRASATLPSIKVTKKRRRRKKRRLSKEDINSMSKEDYKYLQTIKIADHCLKISSSKPPKSDQIGKWHYETEMAAIEAQDVSNWDITSINRFRDMYPRLYEMMTQRGVVTDKNKIIESKISSLCPDGDLRAYLEYLRKTQAERNAAKHHRKKSKSSQVAETSAHVDMYTFEKGKVIMISEDIQRVNSEESILDQGRVGEQLKGGLLADESSEVSRVQPPNESPTLEVPVLEIGIAPETERLSPEKPGVEIPKGGSSLGVGEVNKSSPSGSRSDPARSKVLRKGGASKLNRPLSAKTLPSQLFSPEQKVPKRNTIVELKQSRSNADITPSSPAPSDSRASSQTSSPKKRALSPSRTMSMPRGGDSGDELVETRAEQSRRETQELLQKFDQRLEKSESAFRKAERNRKRSSRKKTVAAAKVMVNAVIETTPKDGDEVVLLPKHKTFDDMLNVEKNNLRAESNWVRKVKAELSGARKLRKAPSVSFATQKDAFRSKRRDTSIRLFQNMVETQKSEEERLRGRQYFGPYKSGELLQIFDLYLQLPKPKLKGTEVVLTATNKSDESEENRDGTGGCVALHDLLKHKYVRSRPHFKAALEKSLLSKVSVSASGGVFMTLQRILVQMCPLMTTADRNDCMSYFAISKAELEAGGEPGEVVYTKKQLKQLRQIFDFFDEDNSGTVDKEEIRKAVNRDIIKSVSASDNLRGGDAVMESGLEEASIESLIDEGDEDNNNELDFDEFVKLFGAMYQ